MTTKLILILFAAVCNAEMILFAVNAKTDKRVTIEFGKSEPDDPSVQDLVKKLLDLDEEMTDLPNVLRTANAIILSHGGRVLEQSANLSEQGVCSEAQVIFERKCHQFVASVIYNPMETGCCTISRHMVYNIPIGPFVSIDLMMLQTEENWRSQMKTEMSDYIKTVIFEVQRSRGAVPDRYICDIVAGDDGKESYIRRKAVKGKRHVGRAVFSPHLIIRVSARDVEMFREAGVSA